MTILVKEIFPIENTSEYKIHFARNNTALEPKNGEEPLDVWVRSEAEWRGWQEHRPKNNAFNKPYIFSLMRFYPEDKENTWLFGGVFRVLERHEDRYKVKLADIRKNLIGRLKIESPYTDRQARTNMKTHYGRFEVKEILSKPYTG